MKTIVLYIHEIINLYNLHENIIVEKFTLNVYFKFWTN